MTKASRALDARHDPDTARDLLTQSGQLLDDGDSEFADYREPEAVRRASAACLLIAQAVLHRDGLTDVASGRILQAYLERFGRGGRLYAAYYRWMSDIADYAAAVELGQAVADDRGTATSLERARLFSDAAVRFVEKTGEGPRQN